MRKLTAAALLVLFLLAFLAVGQAAQKGPPDPKSRQRVWPDESIYFIMIDRFHNGDKANDLNVNPNNPYGWHGGDLQGIIEKLDYIKAMGFTAIWITPHVKNTGQDYHGYGAIDFFEVDEHFGSIAKAKELVEKAHQREMKVLFDIVVNHTGPKHPLVTEKPNWFNRRCEINWSDPKSIENCWIYGLPDFDQSSPEVREYILKYSAFWVEKTGVDGFRLDTVKHVPREFWTWYSDQMQKVKPGFWLLGEAWVESSKLLAAYQEAGVTAMIDFPVSMVAREAFGREAPLSRLAAAVRAMEADMPDPWQAAGFIDNHDMSRFVTHARDDKENRLKVALLFLFTQRSVPILFAGTEVPVENLKGGGDMDLNRPSFPWGAEQNSEVRKLITRLNEVRRANVALRRGTVVELGADRWTYAYGRVAGGNVVVTALNMRENAPYAADLEVAALGLKEGTVLKEALTGKEARVEGGRLKVEVGPRSGVIYTVGGSSGSGAGGWSRGPGLIVLLAAAGAAAAGVGIFWARRRAA